MYNTVVYMYHTVVMHIAVAMMQTKVFHLRTSYIYIIVIFLTDWRVSIVLLSMMI